MAQEKTRGDKGSALVIGAGIAGMQSALLLAEMGRKVFLLEQGPAIGGYFPLLDKTFPTNSCGVCFMSPTPPAFCPIYECHLHDNIELLPYSEVLKVEGEGGDFRVSILRKPRFVDPKRCTLCEACIKVCPVEVEREFGGGLGETKGHLPSLSSSHPSQPRHRSKDLYPMRGMCEGLRSGGDRSRYERRARDD